MTITHIRRNCWKDVSDSGTLGITRTTDRLPPVSPVLKTSERLAHPPPGQPSFRFGDASPAWRKGYGESSVFLARTQDDALANYR